MVHFIEICNFIILRFFSRSSKRQWSSHSSKNWPYEGKPLLSGLKHMKADAQRRESEECTFKPQLTARPASAGGDPLLSSFSFFDSSKKKTSWRWDKYFDSEDTFPRRKPQTRYSCIGSSISQVPRSRIVLTSGIDYSIKEKNWRERRWVSYHLNWCHAFQLSEIMPNNWRKKRSHFAPPLRRTTHLVLEVHPLRRNAHCLKYLHPILIQIPLLCVPIITLETIFQN